MNNATCSRCGVSSDSNPQYSVDALIKRVDELRYELHLVRKEQIYDVLLRDKRGTGCSVLDVMPRSYGMLKLTSEGRAQADAILNELVADGIVEKFTKKSSPCDLYRVVRHE